MNKRSDTDLTFKSLLQSTLDIPPPLYSFLIMLASRTQRLRQMVPVFGYAMMVGVRTACCTNVSPRKRGAVNANRHVYDVRLRN